MIHTKVSAIAARSLRISDWGKYATGFTGLGAPAPKAPPGKAAGLTRGAVVRQLVQYGSVLSGLGAPGDFALAMQPYIGWAAPTVANLIPDAVSRAVCGTTPSNGCLADFAVGTTIGGLVLGGVLLLGLLRGGRR